METFAAREVLNTFACTVATIPEVVLSAGLLEAVAAASSDVPEEALSTCLSHAAALTIVGVLVDEPVEASLTFLFRALPSAVSGVPVLTVVCFASWRAEALTAFVVPVEACIAASSWCFANTLATVIVPEVALIAVTGVNAHAIAVVLAPEESEWAGLWLASAHALIRVEDFVVAANLGSANALADSVVPDLRRSVGVVRAELWKHFASAATEVPVLAVSARPRVAQALAIVGAPEGAFAAFAVVAHALVDVEVPVLTACAVAWNLLTHARAVFLDVPEVANSASLGLLFAAAVDGVEVPSVAAEVVWAASAVASVEVPGVAMFAGGRRRSA